MITLTARQNDVVTFIKAYQAKHQIGPTYREIAAEIGLASTAGVFRIIHGLEARGVLRKPQGLSRCFEFVEDHGADFHLRAILDAMKTFGCVLATDQSVVAATQFIGARP